MTPPNLIIIFFGATVWGFAIALVTTYLRGERTVKTDLHLLKEQVTDAIARVTPAEETLEPGPIHRPSARQLATRNRPIKDKEALAATEQSLDQIPELQQAKQNVEKYRSSLKGNRDLWEDYGKH